MKVGELLELKWHKALQSIHGMIRDGLPPSVTAYDGSASCICAKLRRSLFSRYLSQQLSAPKQRAPTSRALRQAHNRNLHAKPLTIQQRNRAMICRRIR